MSGLGVGVARSPFSAFTPKPTWPEVGKVNPLFAEEEEGKEEEEVEKEDHDNDFDARSMEDVFVEAAVFVEPAFFEEPA